MPNAIPLDIVILGGGAAGLWLLDDLTRAGHSSLLLEAHDLGSGQTIASQGIIHGGLKYTLSGLLTSSARAIREMPMIWRRCLAGEAHPNLANTRLRAEYCHLWRTTSLKSRLSMIGARAGLKIAPLKLDANQRPAALADVPGQVARLDEQVIEPASFINDLAQQHRARILKVDADHGLEFVTQEPGQVQLIRLLNPDTGRALDLRPTHVVLTAGASNAALRKLLGLDDRAMQRRPLHMVMIRSPNLPTLNGHCIDGSTTRLTITTTKGSDDRIVWQIGGRIAEDGANMHPPELIEHARAELEFLLPAVDLAGVEWSTYRIDRAEPAMRSGGRPDDIHAHRQGNTITAWPTKMALVPELARRIISIINDTQPARSASEGVRPSSTYTQPARSASEGVPLSSIQFADWPRPVVALPPWETQQQWHSAL